MSKKLNILFLGGGKRTSLAERFLESGRKMNLKVNIFSYEISNEVPINSMAKIIVILSIAGAVLFLPSISMYYGMHHWTSSLTGGVVDARFIAIINTAVESPLGQVSMIPLLAWIAKSAPAHLKATFFAVFASFTNLALSASALGTKYLNQVFIVTREVKDKITNDIVTTADYSELGFLLITVAAIALILPVGTVIIIQHSRFRTTD